MFETLLAIAGAVLCGLVLLVALANGDVPV